MSRARLAVLVLGAGALGSQAGHLLAYQLRFGAAAQQLQSSGVHAYWPVLVKTGLGLVALSLLASLLVVGAARVASGRRIEPGSAPAFVPLLAAVYTIQLACFAGQETAETLAGGAPAAPLLALLLWGTAGQLPVAVVTTLALRWLLARVRPALGLLRLRPASTFQRFGDSVALVSRPRDTDVVLAYVIGASDPLRGPPSSF
jgi:hypothetical protein